MSFELYGEHTFWPREMFLACRGRRDLWTCLGTMRDSIPLQHSLYFLTYNLYPEVTVSVRELSKKNVLFFPDFFSEFPGRDDVTSYFSRRKSVLITFNLAYIYR